MDFVAKQLSLLAFLVWLRKLTRTSYNKDRPYKASSNLFQIRGT